MNIEFKKNKFKSCISYFRNTNVPINKIFGDFFSSLFQDKELQKKYNIDNIDIISEGELQSSVKLIDLGIHNILINFLDLRILLRFDIFKNSGGEKKYELNIITNDQTKITGESVFNQLLYYAVQESNIKGSYLILADHELYWEANKITERTFNDIFLPNRISNELRFYKKVFREQDFLMRYLFVGIPGTGKTESTIVLQNELNKLGVTILKTNICDVFKEKVRLAEMLAPSIIILDDIDLALGSRNSGHITKNLETFLDVLDGTEKISDNVGIIATTNSVKLLDVAAKRPGRFHKVILFDELTKDNIKNIIIKSLKINFRLAKINSAFTSDKAVELYKSNGWTGSHIFNLTELLYRKYKALGLNGSLNEDWVIHEIENEVSILEKTQKFNGLIEETLKNSIGKNLGYIDNNSIDNNEEEMFEDVEAPIECKEDVVARDSKSYNK